MSSTPNSATAPARFTPRLKKRARKAHNEQPILARAITSARDRVTIYLTLGFLGVMWAVPMYSAVKKSLEVHGLQNYISLFTEPVADVSIPQTYLNSLIVGSIHALLVVSISTLAGYAFSQLHWPGRETVFAGVLLFLAIPAAAMIVPFYFINNHAGLFNNFLGVGLAETAITIPLGVLLMRNYGRSVSASLMEAAQLDGAGHTRAFWNVFLPLSRPPVLNLTVLCFVWSMQDFMWPSIFLRNSSMTTAAQAVMTLNTGLGANPTDIGRYNASLVLLALPALLIVLFGMRFIINGLTSGATKG